MAISDTPADDNEIWVDLTPQIAPRQSKDVREMRFGLWGRKAPQSVPQDLERVVDAFRCAGQI